MSAALLDQLLASPSPFDDVFDGELLPCGRRIDLEARCIGWQPLGLRQAISDAQAVWNGTDDAAWELELVAC
jgi:hypothetical protein